MCTVHTGFCQNFCLVFFVKVVENARFTWAVWAQDDISVKKAVRVARHRNCRPLTSHKKSNGNNVFNLKVVTNEKGEAVGEVLTIICKWGRWCWMFFCHFNGLPSCMNSYLLFR
jgi:hypothetical protein